MDIQKSNLYKRDLSKTKVDISQQIEKTIEQLTNNLNHPSLNNKNIKCKKADNLFSIRVNKQYRIMQADMHNLFPAIGELNADRKNFRFDFEIGKSGQYGACEFNVLFKQKRARVQEDLRGVIARDYLYFHKKYKMRLSKQEMKKFKAWNKLYPTTSWEKQRNRRIAKIQGNANEFIK